MFRCSSLAYNYLRNFNSPNHGSNLQHIKHQAKTNLIKSVVTGEPTKLLRRRSNCILGNTKSKCSRHILTTCISVVLNNFMKMRLTTKSVIYLKEVLLVHIIKLVFFNVHHQMNACAG